MIFCSWQFIPKWKYTVHYQQLHGSTGLGIETQKSHNKYNPTIFTNSKEAWTFFWDLIRRRDHPDRLDIGGEPDIIRKVRIDSVSIK